MNAAMKLIKFSTAHQPLEDLIAAGTDILAALIGNLNFPSLPAQVATTDALRVALGIKLTERGAAEAALKTKLNEVIALRAQFETDMV